MFIKNAIVKGVSELLASGGLIYNSLKGSVPCFRYTPLARCSRSLIPYMRFIINYRKMTAVLVHLIGQHFGGSEAEFSISDWHRRFVGVKEPRDIVSYKYRAGILVIIHSFQ